MDSSSWDFNAPTTFIDFSSGEHLRNAGIDENYFSYDHEKSPQVDKSMEFKPSGLSDVTNKSRLTFDSPAKATPKTPVIKPMRFRLQDQNGNHKMLNADSLHQGDGPDVKTEVQDVDLEPSQQEPVCTEAEQNGVKNVDNHEARTDVRTSTKIEHNEQTHADEDDDGDVCMSNENGRNVETVDSHEACTDVRSLIKTEQEDVKRDDDGNICMSNENGHNPDNVDEVTSTMIKTPSQDEQTDAINNTDDHGTSTISGAKAQPSQSLENSADKQMDVTDQTNEVNEISKNNGDVAVKNEEVSSKDDLPMELTNEQVSDAKGDISTKEVGGTDDTAKTRSKVASVGEAEMLVDSLDEETGSDNGAHTPTNKTPVGQSRRLRSSQAKYGNLRSQALQKQRLQRSGKLATPAANVDPDAPPLKKLKGNGSAQCRKSTNVPMRSRSRQGTPLYRLATPKDGPVKSHPMERRSARSSGVDFVKGLRQYPVSQKKMTPTITKPFHFSSDRKRKLDFNEKNKNETYNFEKAAKAGIKKGPFKIKPALTVPRTPNLRSRTRKRPPSVVSAQEMEEKEIEEMKNYRFKAKPANQKMLREPSPLPDVEKPYTTKPEEFHFSTDERIQDKTKIDPPPSPSREFKAKPIPKSIFKPPMIEPAKIQRKIHEKLTKPRSPGPKPVQEKRMNTKVIPFSFYERDMERLAKKEKKIKMIHDAERAVESEEEAMRERRNFKANETYKDSLHRPGWRPKLEGKHTENFEEFTLHSMSRASQRSDFDERMKCKEAHAMAQKEEERREEERRLEEEAKEMRKKAEFKANPVRKYKTLEIMGSDKMPTLPESPNFSDRFYKKLPETEKPEQ